MELSRGELRELILLLEHVRIQDDGGTRASIRFTGQMEGAPYKITLEAADGSAAQIKLSGPEEYRMVCRLLLDHLKKGHEDGVSFAAVVSGLIDKAPVLPVARA
jgi:hypothetical protein